MLEYVVGGLLDARILPVGSELPEVDDLPECAAVFWQVSGSGLDPVTVAFLRLEDRLHRMRVHGLSARGEQLRIIAGCVE